MSMYLQKVVIKIKNFLVLKATDEKNRIRIRNPAVRICRSGFVPKCHGSTTLIFSKGGVSGSTYLKGLSHEIDFKNFDKNLQNLAELRDAAGF